MGAIVTKGISPLIYKLVKDHLTYSSLKKKHVKQIVMSYEAIETVCGVEALRYRHVENIVAQCALVGIPCTPRRGTMLFEMDIRKLTLDIKRRVSAE